MGLQIKTVRTNSNFVAAKKADIVFCIDNSGSMSSCIEAVRNTVSVFVSSLEKGVGGQSPVDWRIGLVDYSQSEFLFMDLAKDTATFQNKLRENVSGGDEFTPGAIDFAISNASWREGAQRVIVVFTDEPLNGGSGGAHEFDDLLRKIVDSHIQIIYYGCPCEYYEKFQQCPKAEVNFVNNFSGIDFSNLMNRLAVTVSSSSPFAGKEPVVTKMVYDLSAITVKN